MDGMEDDFSIFHTGNFLPFHTKNLPFHAKNFFRIPYFHTKEVLDWNQYHVYSSLHLCSVVSNHAEGARNSTKISIWYAHCTSLMHRRR